MKIEDSKVLEEAVPGTVVLDATGRVWVNRGEDDWYADGTAASYSYNGIVLPAETLHTDESAAATETNAYLIRLIARIAEVEGERDKMFEDGLPLARIVGQIRTIVNSGSRMVSRDVLESIILNAERVDNE